MHALVRRRERRTTCSEKESLVLQKCLQKLSEKSIDRRIRCT